MELEIEMQFPVFTYEHFFKRTCFVCLSKKLMKIAFFGLKSSEDRREKLEKSKIEGLRNAFVVEVELEVGKFQILWLH